MTKNQSGSAERRIPSALNLMIALFAYTFSLFCLAGASGRGLYYESPIFTFLFAAGFSLSGNTIYSLLHESVHRIFSRNLWVNNAFGILSAAFFPTGFTFHKISHLGHHRRNRTDLELFDYYTDPKDRFLKSYQLYSLLTGFYWLSIPVGCILYLFMGPLFRSQLFLDKAVKPMGLKPMADAIIESKKKFLAAEILFTIFFQVGIFYLFNLSIEGVFACYAAFALLWSSLQYTDHAWSVRDVKNGAWNLKVNPVMRYIFLNYHFHLAHHQHPGISWINLPQYADPGETRPSHLGIYLSLWKGPRFTEEAPPADLDKKTLEELERQL